MFSRQVEALAKPGDVVWGISTSGNSKNVVAALKAARERAASTIALTGQGGGAMAEYADVLLAVPLSVTPRIQEVHSRYLSHYLRSGGGGAVQPAEERARFRLAR